MLAQRGAGVVMPIQPALLQNGHHLVNELVEAADERVLSRVVARYGRLDLLCLDELGYVQIDPRGTELLFQIITEREERASIAIATNLPFSKAHMFNRTCVLCGQMWWGSAEAAWRPCGFPVGADGESESRVSSMRSAR